MSQSDIPEKLAPYRSKSSGEDENDPPTIVKGNWADISERAEMEEQGSFTRFHSNKGDLFLGNQGKPEASYGKGYTYIPNGAPNTLMASPACTSSKKKAARVATAIIDLLSDSGLSNKEVTSCLKMASSIYGLQVHSTQSSAVSVFDSRLTIGKPTSDSKGPKGGQKGNAANVPAKPKGVAKQSPSAAWKLTPEGGVLAAELAKASKAVSNYRKQNPSAKEDDPALSKLYAERKVLDDRRKALNASLA
jgi:hypothetical protein